MAMISAKDAFLSSLPLGNLKGVEKFLAVAFAMAQEQIGKSIELRGIQLEWPTHVLSAAYSPKFYPTAKMLKWVMPNGTGALIVTQKGADHLNAIRTPNPKVVKGLMIFGKKTPHTFDKTLRTLFKGTEDVVIADTYVDDSIFDTVLDEIPRTATVRLLWGKVWPPERQPAFDVRARRFGVEYPQYKMKSYRGFHDRFFIVDGVGYTLGPSLKDAAAVKPATLVGLDADDSKKLGDFFQELWVDAS